ncbi:MAG: hemerythrin domain-containing protein [Candidatus Kryptoniota bacterium]
MPRVLYRYLANDHGRLDKLLERAISKPELIDMDSYTEFRKGLLRHIGIEEKIFLPAISRLQNGKQAEVAARLRLDHGALVALLVPSPTMPIVETIRLILRVHNLLEEEEDGVYQLIDSLVGKKDEGLIERVKNYPDVPMNPYNDRPGVLDVARRAVERAGYKFQDI